MRAVLYEKPLVDLLTNLLTVSVPKAQNIVSCLCPYEWNPPVIMSLFELVPAAALYVLSGQVGRADRDRCMTS